MENKTTNHFYQKVSEYYDLDADLGFKKRAESNVLLDRIRNDFRKVTITYPFSNILEIGCGPGFDVCWFAKTYPESRVTGVDISPKMIETTLEQIKRLALKNATARVCDERGLVEAFGKANFDMVYVYFGALNTVADLSHAASQIHNLLVHGGHAVLTFVNKWYLREMVVQAMKLNFKIAFARLRKEWGGYSVDRHLPSRCYSPREILAAFRDFKLIERKGYSIKFPAWYNAHKVKNNPEKADALWQSDQELQKSWWWSKGEYTLFVFRKD
ncbi:MAG: class I SAM-dependent methyltransferase [Bacteroidales bacterium]|nr:class I SAM-dependent methyltransferase [Bacteroidales bacterium]